MADKDEIRKEYAADDLGKGTQGKYYEEYSQDANIVVLDPGTYLQEHPDDASAES